MRRDDSGVLYITDKDGEYQDKVGWDYRGHKILVPWNSGLIFVCSGPCRVAKVQERPTEDNAGLETEMET